MKKLFLFLVAFAITVLKLQAAVSYLDEPALLGTWGVYEASSSNLPVKFVFEEDQALIYEANYYGEIIPKKYVAFIIGGSITGRYTLHFVGSTGYGDNGYAHGWRNFIIKSFNTYTSEFILTDYGETFTLKLKKDYDPITENQPSEPEYVDLGLSVLWATCNLGASTPYESGNYYAWGETIPNKAIYDEKTYEIDLEKIPNNIAGTEYDAAFVELGNGWHIPSDENFKELIDQCVWEYSETDHGFYVTGPNKNKLFFLLAGAKEGDRFVGYIPNLSWSNGFYMSDTRRDNLLSNYYLFLDKSPYYDVLRNLVTRGQTIRPVKYNTNRAPVISKDQESCVNVYNLAGQLEFINVPIKDLQEVLPKGVHIINGYKLLIE